MRRVLLDTHAFLWWLTDDPRLGKISRACISAPGNVIYVSAATNWEISVKRSLGKLETPDDIDSIIENRGFSKLPISNFHGDKAGALPKHHRDPFDRMLIAQAQSEGLELITKDEIFPLYSVKIINALE